jgi:hypothetical protein
MRACDRPLKPFLVVCALASGACTAADQATDMFDISGIEPFWDVHDTLAADAEPSDSLWEALWSTPGYALLEGVERRRPALSDGFRLAFRPSMRAAADSVLAGRSWVARIIPHAREIAEARDSLTGFVEELQSSDWLAQGRELAQSYLPAGTTELYEPPLVSFFYFLDARGYSERLLLDPLFFMRVRNRVEIMAHEFHHYYTGKIGRPLKSFGEDFLAWSLSTTENEGIAGMLDKAEVPGMSPEELIRAYPDSSRRAYFAMYQEEYRISNERLAQVEDVLERVAAHPDSLDTLGRWINRELPDNGRIMGAYMAVVIEEELGRESLLEVVGDAFGFWRRYNTAAQRTGGRARILSDEAMRMLDEVEAKYLPDA